MVVFCFYHEAKSALGFLLHDFLSGFFLAWQYQCVTESFFHSINFVIVIIQRELKIEKLFILHGDLNKKSDALIKGQVANSFWEFIIL